MQTIIMAGGKGTRISEIAPYIPKPMLPICGKPILEHQIDCLKSQGLCDITIATGYMGAVISEHFGDGSNFGVRLSYFREDTPLGSGGALLEIPLEDNFLLINGDIIFDVQLAPIVDFHMKSGGLATLVTHPNNHPYDSGLIFADDNGLVTKWLHKEDRRTIYHNRVNTGLHIISKEAIKPFAGQKRKIDLDREILEPLIATKRVFAYDSTEYIKDMGTPERYEAVCLDVTNKRPEKRSLRNKQRAVFLDRDGVINKNVGLISKLEQFELLPGVGQAVKRINELGYLAIVITNQSVIARGDCTIEGLDEIHQLMETQLGNEGAYIDALFYCPHHPDKGFEGERAEYKIVCDCRKPKPGMLLKAAEKFNIDLEKSCMVGDSVSDVEAAVAAGCKPILIGEKYKSLLDFVEALGLW